MGATGVVKERMDLMVSLSKSMKALHSMIQGKVNYDDTMLVDGADQMSEQSRRMKMLFPSGSMQAPSVAKPEIWTDSSKFNALADRLGAETEKLIEIGKNGDRKDLMPQFRRIGAACSACHKLFRSKKHTK